MRWSAIRKEKILLHSIPERMLVSCSRKANILPLSDSFVKFILFLLSLHICKPNIILGPEPHHEKQVETLDTSSI